MSILLKEDFITMNTSLWYNKHTSASEESQNQNTTETAAETSEETTPTKETNKTDNGFPLKATTPDGWLKWGTWLKEKLEANSKLSAEAQESALEIINKFFAEFYTTNWPTCGEKLLTFDKFKNYFIRNNKVHIDAFNLNKSPVLSFMTKDYVVTNLIPKMNPEKFTAILLAYTKNIVSSSEFMRNISSGKEYNIIYCKDLYNKSAKEIYEYLQLQNSILKGDSISLDAQSENRITFLKTSSIAEAEPTARAKNIREYIKNKNYPSDITTVETGELNDLELVKLVKNSDHTITSSLNNEGKDTLVTKLSTPADKFAAIFTLSITTNSSEAKKALNHEKFKSLGTDEKFNAITKLAASGTMPKGQLNKSDADGLVARIIASLS